MERSPRLAAVAITLLLAPALASADEPWQILRPTNTGIPGESVLSAGAGLDAMPLDCQFRQGSLRHRFGLGSQHGE